MQNTLTAPIDFCGNLKTIHRLLLNQAKNDGMGITFQNVAVNCCHRSLLATHQLLVACLPPIAIHKCKIYAIDDATPVNIGEGIISAPNRIQIVIIDLADSIVVV
jgi:hypothetical protein